MCPRAVQRNSLYKIHVTFLCWNIILQEKIIIIMVSEVEKI